MGTLTKPVNDVTTNLEHPLEYIKEIDHHRTLEKLNQYQNHFSQIQKKHHPEIKGLELEANMDLSSFFQGKIQLVLKCFIYTFLVALSTAREMPRWKEIAVDESSHKFQFSATTFLFHFVDDVVVQVQETSEHHFLIHMRSKSRVGISDWQANANRIKKYFTALEQNIKKK